MILGSIIKGFIGAVALLAVYFVVVSAISGWSFTLDQLSQFWYFIFSLAAGFGIQIGLYSYLRNVIHSSASKGVMVASGATSTVAMISCCAHYLVNILPVVGVTGVVSILGQYQIEFFWVGLLANLIGIVYILRRIRAFHGA